MIVIHLAILILPVLIAGVLHMLLVKAHAFERLARPVHRRLFGANKTWRGFLLMPLLGVLGIVVALALQGSQGPLPLRAGDWKQALLLGASLGLAYALFELPNSYLKRRLGVPPGEQAHVAKPLFFALDRLDSATGCSLVYLLFGVDTSLVALVLPGAACVHLAATYALNRAGLKARM